MAIARCEFCENPKGRKQTYVLPVEPVGYPFSSTICGSQGCESAAYIWLTENERNEYYDGRRIFVFATAAVKVRVKDDALKG